MFFSDRAGFEFRNDYETQICPGVKTAQELKVTVLIFPFQYIATNVECDVSVAAFAAYVRQVKTKLREKPTVASSR